MSDDRLSTYRDKRDFSKSPEPPGSDGAAGDKERIFVIQQHAASSMHFDFRLEVDGVLKSWAVPKGPSTDPADKRLALPTEDHPLDYADFEGVIPEDEYGGGTVIVWDAGRYANLKTDDEGEEIPMAQTIEDGRVEISLAGKKIEGGYALVRTSDERWLLIKMKGEGADRRRKPAKTEPESVLTGRTIEQVAEQEGDDQGE